MKHNINWGYLKSLNRDSVCKSSLRGAINTLDKVSRTGSSHEIVSIKTAGTPNYIMEKCNWIERFAES